MDLTKVSRLGLLAVIAVAVAAVALFTHGGETSPAVAVKGAANNSLLAAPSQPELSGLAEGEVAGIAIDDYPDFSISANPDCDTNEDNKKCLVPPGGSFTVEFTLKDLGGIIAPNGYNRIEMQLDYSWNLTVKKPPVAFPGSPCDEGLIGWLVRGDGVFSVACHSFTGPQSYTGPLISVEFNCPNFKTKEVVTLANGWAPSGQSGGNVTTGTGTLLRNSGDNLYYGEFGRNESLIINCDNYFPWDVHGPNQSADLDGVVDLPNDILGVILHFGQNKPTP